MHVNNHKPNILEDIVAASNGRDLRDRDSYGNLKAKRHVTLHRVYPYSSVRQNTRIQRYLNKVMARNYDLV